MLRLIARALYIAAIAGALTLAYVTAANAAEPTPEQRSVITKYARQYNLDPRLMLAIAGVESNYNPHAVGALGEQGLFQLRPEFHAGADLTSLDGNVHTAARYLAYLRTVCRPTRGAAWLTCYNTGPHRALRTPPSESRYYRRVQALYLQQLAAAAVTNGER